ncbi:MAG: NeuD/PglB/VioB family sugar acetyltransferase [Ferruginibacter sp.]
MVIAGARGHALEILDIVLAVLPKGEIVFFDPVTTIHDIEAISHYPVLKTWEQLRVKFEQDPGFILGMGDSFIRKKMAEECIRLGGKLQSAISASAYISNIDVNLGAGLNIMHRVVIQPAVKIGEGTLINAGAFIHHETAIGKYCQICPGVFLTGATSVGDYSMIGTGAVVLPKVKIGNNVVVAAGSIVTHDIPDSVMVAGSPAVIKKERACL